MASFVIPLLINGLLPWWLFSSLVYLFTSKLTTRNNPSPRVWWVAFVISFFPFMPMSFGTIEMTIPDLAYVSAGIESAQIATQASITHAKLSNADLLAALVILIYLGVTGFKLARLVRSWKTLKQWVNSAEIIESDSARDVVTLVSDSDHSPFVFGTTQPKIILPDYFWSFDPRQQQVLIQHELTHISNKDHVTVLLWRVLSSVLWINPIVRKMEWQHVRAVEHRCDKDTIKGFNINVHLYASTLLESLKRSMTQSRFDDMAGVNFGAGRTSRIAKDAKPLAQFNSAALGVEDYKMRLSNIVRSEHRVKNNRDTHRLLKRWLPVMASLCCFAVMIKELKVTDEVNWQHPLDTYKVSSPFSSIDQIRNYKPHQGVDYVAPVGSSVSSAADGMVVVADDLTLNPNYGMAVLIQHKGGYQTLYAHLASIEVKAGAWIKAGEKVGIIGKSGKATGVHLHFEVLKDKHRINPTELIEN